MDNNPIYDFLNKKDKSLENESNPIVNFLNSKSYKEPKETLSESVVAAPGRIAEDIGNTALSAVGKIPDLYESAKTEIPGLAKTAIEHPGHLAKQVVGGGSDLLSSIINTLHNADEYSAKRLNIPHGASRLLGISPSLVPHNENIEKWTQENIGEPQYPGEKLARGLVANAPLGLGSANIAKALNPMKYTAGNIAKNILKAEEKAKAAYSGENGLYNKLAEEAKSRGVTGNHINPDKMDLEVLKKDLPENELVAIEKLLNDKNPVNAQNAISNLGYRERVLKSKANRDILTEPEKDLRKAVANVKNHIQENMFKDEKGKVHQDLIEQHKEIQKGYAKDVIPYTKNPAIQAYKAGDKTANAMIDYLARPSGKFAARKLPEHPEIGKRKLYNNLVKTFGMKALQGAGFGAGAYGVYSAIPHKD